MVKLLDDDLLLVIRFQTFILGLMNFISLVWVYADLVKWFSIVI